MLGGDTGGKGEGEGTGEDFGKQMKREEESIVNRKQQTKVRKDAFAARLKLTFVWGILGGSVGDPWGIRNGLGGSWLGGMAFYYMFFIFRWGIRRHQVRLL